MIKAKRNTEEFASKEPLDQEANNYAKSFQDEYSLLNVSCSSSQETSHVHFNTGIDQEEIQEVLFNQSTKSDSYDEIEH